MVGDDDDGDDGDGDDDDDGDGDDDEDDEWLMMNDEVLTQSNATQLSRFTRLLFIKHGSPWHPPVDGPWSHWSHWYGGFHSVLQ